MAVPDVTKKLVNSAAGSMISIDRTLWQLWWPKLVSCQLLRDKIKVAVLNAGECLAFCGVNEATSDFGHTTASRNIVWMTRATEAVTLLEFAAIAERCTAAFGTHGLVLAVHAN